MVSRPAAITVILIIAIAHSQFSPKTARRYQIIQSYGLPPSRKLTKPEMTTTLEIPIPPFIPFTNRERLAKT